MERSMINKGQDGLLDKVEEALQKEYGGQLVGFVLITVSDKEDNKGSRLCTMSNMGPAQLPRLLHTVSHDLIAPALEGYEKTHDLVEKIEAKLSEIPEDLISEDAPAETH